MRKSGSGLGSIVLLIALAIVLLLAVRAWSGGAADAARTLDAARALDAAPAGGTADAAGAGGPPPQGVDRGALPDLNDMRRGTDAHADDVQDALQQIP